MSALKCTDNQIPIDPNLQQVINRNVGDEKNKLEGFCVTPKVLGNGDKEISWNTQLTYVGHQVSSYVENDFVMGRLNGKDTYTLVTLNCINTNPSIIPAAFTCTQTSSQDVSDAFKDFTDRLQKLRSTI